MKVLGFAGSNSKNSINKELVKYTLNQLEDIETELLDLNDFELPLYGIDLENEKGIHAEAYRFKDYINRTDGLVISLAEHNGAYSTVFKNLFDWLSRIERKVWSDKPMLLMSTSTGARGGASVMQIAMDRFPRMGTEIVANFSLPSFKDNFKDGAIVHKELKNELQNSIQIFKKSLNHEN